MEHKANNQLYPSLENYVKNLFLDFNKIPEERKLLLNKLAGFVDSKSKQKTTARLIFICTHNSRRSHLSQIWAQTAAYYYRIEGVECFSGGTEATSFNPRAVKAIKNAGFEVTSEGVSDNPVYLISFAEGFSTQAYSKKYDAQGNPTEDFCAIMTCTHADQNCPFIPSALARLPISYDDPKDFDGTSLEEAKYEERCKQIGTEIFYAFSQVNK